jgi:ADP-ribose pyrophosphatase YjhB (NUDIX family)
MKNKKFNIRVYGIVVYNGKILLSHENYRNHKFTKFPGGGLEWGESTHDCLVREFKEELNIDVEPGFLFHVTETFQQSKFFPNDQVLGVYFLVNSNELDKIIIGKRLSINPDKGETFEWVSLDDFNIESLTFATDREAAAKLLGGERVSLKTP